MRIVQIKSTATTGQSDPFEPRASTVGISVSAEGSGAVAATFQVKARAMPNMPLENIGSPFTISGTNVASTSQAFEKVVAGQVIVDFSLASCLSLNCVATEPER